MSIKDFRNFIETSDLNESSDRKTKIAKFLDNVRYNVDFMMKEMDYLK